MNQKSPQEQVRFSAALRYLDMAAGELEAAGENLAAMRVSAIAGALR